LELAAEVVYDPEKQAEKDAKQKAGDDGEGDRPAASAPVEVAGKAAERDVEAIEAEDDESRHDEQEAKEDQDAAKVRHRLD
jgi:hypothetical protein